MVFLSEGEVLHMRLGYLMTFRESALLADGIALKRLGYT